MAITEKREVVSVYGADVDGFVAGHRKMKKSIEETQESHLGWAKDVQTSLNDGVEWLGKFNQGFEGAKKIIDFATESVKAFAEHQRLAAAAGSADIDRLAKAAGGLRNETELLSFAAKAQHGVIRASQADMETAEKAMRMLSRAGFDQAEVSKKIEDAMVSLKVNGLDDLGISVKKGSTDIETFNNLMAELAKKAAGADSATETTGEKVQRMGVDFHDAFEKMRMAVGQMVVAMLPLVESVAKITKSVGDLVTAHPSLLAGGIQGMQEGAGTIFGGGGAIPGLGDLDFGSFFENFAPKSFGAKAEFNPQLAEFQKGFNEALLRARQGSAFEPISSLLDQIGAGSAVFGKAMNSEQFNAALKAFVDKAKDDYKKASDAAQKLLDERKKLADKVAKELTDDLVKKLEAEQNAHAHSASDDSIAAKFAKQQKLFGGINEQLAQGPTEDRYNRFQTAKQESFLEKAFGKPDEFAIYQEMFGALSTAVTGMYEAIVTGSEPAGKAFKKMAAGALIAVGAQETVMALKEEAWAIGDLAIGNAAGAALHQMSALKHAAVAILAGATAHQLGAGGGSSSARGASGGSAGASSGGASISGSGPMREGPRIVVIQGDSFADDSPRIRQLTAERAFEKAFGPSQGVANK